MLTQKNLDPIYELALELNEEPNLDSLIEQANTKLAKIIGVDFVYFGIINEDNLILQGKDAKKLREIQYDRNVFETLTKGNLCINDSFVFLPINIKSKPCACLCFSEIRNLNEELKKLLLYFSKSLSITITQKQSLIDLQQHNEKLLYECKQKTDLLCTISHELRTPMSTILGFSELLANKTFPEEEAKIYQKEVFQSAQKLNSLIDNFLDLARIESASDLILENFEEVEIDWLAQKAWEALKNQNFKHELAIYLDQETPNIKLDPEAMIRVFGNLFSNAIKYSPSKGNKKQKIICEIKYLKKEILVNVIDNGIGLSENSIEFLFDKFYRSPEHNSIGGSGLGLWICKQIVEAHGGKIWCSRNNTKGSTFSFSIPIQ